MGCKNKCKCDSYERPFYILEVPAGTYSSDNLFSLVWEIIKHRTWHLIKHGRWVD